MSTGETVQQASSNAPILVVSALATLSFQLLLPVFPIVAEQHGVHGSAGAVTTAIFLGMIGGEVLTPWLISRLSAPMTLALAELVVSASAGVFLVSDVTVLELLPSALIRGIGIGIVLVVSAAMVTRLASTNRRGLAIGNFGLITGMPSIVCPSIALWLLAAGHLTWVVVIAVTAPLGGVVLALRLRAREATDRLSRTNPFVLLRRPPLLAVFSSFALVSCAIGGVFTYIPITLTESGVGSAATFFLISGACRALGRWVSGPLSDSYSAKAVMASGIALSAGGLGVLAFSLQSEVVICGAIVFGIGSGATQTGAFLALIERTSTSEWDMVSAIWNGAIDLGSTMGSGITGLTAASYGYSAAMVVVPAIMSTALVVLAFSRRPTPAAMPPR